jgi:quercetin dioxygenase-like cupin family protein
MDPTVLKNYHDAAQFQSERFSPVAIAETKRLKVVLTCFEAGQFIPVHAPTVDMALVVSPPPTESDHAAVQAGLQQRTWR